MQDDLQTIRNEIEKLAGDAKQASRRWWVWLLLIQGLAVTLPLMWLTKRWTGIGWLHALVILLCVIAMVALAWWLRWRGMQKIWARARLVAEVGRSLLATQRLGRFPAFQVFSVVPALRPLRWCKFPNSEPVNDLGEWRNWYIERDVGVQLKYFSLDTQAKLEKEREKLNRWATRLLDVSLAFAAAGFVAMLFNFTSFFGGARLKLSSAQRG